MDSGLFWTDKVCSGEERGVEYNSPQKLCPNPTTLAVVTLFAMPVRKAEHRRAWRRRLLAELVTELHMQVTIHCNTCRLEVRGMCVLPFR